MDYAIEALRTPSQQLLKVLPVEDMLALMNEDDEIMNNYYFKKAKVETFEEEQARKSKIEADAAVMWRPELPELKIDEFYGNPVQWNFWWSMGLI